MAPSVAIAVVSWNTRDLLRACLASIEPEVRAGLAEAWVVDNASSDNSAAMVSETFAWARLIASTTNLGFGAAVNAVAARTQARWIAPANADIELTPGALRRMLEVAERDPRIGIVAPRLLLPDDRTQHSVYAFPTLPFTLAFNLGLAELSDRVADQLALEGRWNPDRARTVDWAIGAFLLIRREAWDRAGGFDPRQWMYAEDLDLGWRLAAAGWRTRYEPEAVVRHHASASTSQAWGEARTEQWMRSTYAWMLRRRGPAVTRAAALVNTLGAAARAMLVAGPALALGGERRATWRMMLMWTALHFQNLVRPQAEFERHR